MRTSIIIAAHNEGKLLDRTLQSISEMIGSLECEIIVVDDATTDGSVAAAKKRFPLLRVLATDERMGPAASKDLGAREACGETLVFLDGHTKPERSAISRMVQQIEALQGQSIILPRGANPIGTLHVL